ncbi:MAG: outer membrane beta-barrel family protein, partial [Alistipes sp.]|nr:outer membrane beta-barrel family protein [Alistipes sp.]
MKKLLLAIAVTALAAGYANAQRRSTVSGVVADADTHNTIIGVIIEMTPVSDSTKSTAVVSGAGGAFSMGLDRGEHRLRASLLGYETVRRDVDITETRQTVDTVYIRQGINIDAVVKEAVVMRTSVKSDTLIYNANSYKVTADADVSSLLAKMPGITVNGSTVEAQGETIRKVLLDGKEYFGEDVGAAISSIPAEAIQSIELFDKLSDSAEFTGIDDGESYKTLNLVTREAMRVMITGKVNGLYGIEPPKYDGDTWHNFGMVGGNVNILQGESRLTLGGNLNNINERHFTFTDPLGVGDDDGIAKVGRFQATYRDLLGKKKAWDVNATYTYNVTDAKSSREIDRTYYETDVNGNPSPWARYESESYDSNFNQGHNFNTRIDFKPNAYNQLMIRAGANYQGNRSKDSGLETYTPRTGLVDFESPTLLENWENSHQKRFSSNVMAMYSVRLGKQGRTLMFMTNGGYGPGSGEDEEYNDRAGMPARWATEPFGSLSYNVGGGVVYTEPIGKNSLIALDYNFGHSFSDSDRKSYLRPLLDDGSWGDYDWTAPERSLSSVLTNKRTTHRIGPRYSFSKGGTTFVAGVGYQYMTSEVNRVMPEPLDLKAGFHNVTYNVMLRARVADGHQLRADIRSRMQNPNVADLQDIPDISNPSNISRGNPKLKSSYTNSLSVNYNIAMAQRGQTLTFNLSAGQTSNSIVHRALINSEGFPIYNSDGEIVDYLDGVGRYTEPVNLNGAWDARFGVGFGFPVKFMRSNINLNAGVSYNERPSQIGSWNSSMTEPLYSTNSMSTIAPNAGIYIGSNISENVDFGVNYRVSYSDVRNTFATNGNNETLSHFARFNYKFILPLSFTFSGNASYSINKNMTRAQSNEYLMINMAIGKKVFRSKLGEVNLFVNNLLDKNDSFRRTFADDYFQNAIRSTIGRYFGVSFTWNIRNFRGSGSSTGSSSEHGFGDGHEHGRERGDFQGPPPGGPGG